jgi:hypothetical protein
MLNTFLMSVLALPLMGCGLMKALDFGGTDEKAFEFHFGWEHGIHDGSAPPGKVDKDGVYTPETKEVDSILGFPNIHAGLAYEIQPKGRITPTVQVEAFRFKVPELRWWEIQVGAGAQIVELYLGKRLVSVYEVTVGPWVGWDFDESHKQGPGFFSKLAWGVGFTLIKF